MSMPQYKVEFRVNGRRSEEIVSAYNTSDAKKIVEARYNGSKVSFIHVTRV